MPQSNYYGGYVLLKFHVATLKFFPRCQGMHMHMQKNGISNKSVTSAVVQAGDNCSLLFIHSCRIRMANMSLTVGSFIVLYCSPLAMLFRAAENFNFKIMVLKPEDRPRSFDDCCTAVKIRKILYAKGQNYK